MPQCRKKTRRRNEIAPLPLLGSGSKQRLHRTIKVSVNVRVAYIAERLNRDAWWMPNPQLLPMMCLTESWSMIAMPIFCTSAEVILKSKPFSNDSPQDLRYQSQERFLNTKELKHIRHGATTQLHASNISWGLETFETDSCRFFGHQHTVKAANWVVVHSP
jgi:hypothetical protein